MLVLLCQSCGKNNATIHFTKIINGHVEEKHLCEACAKVINDFDFELPFSFQKLFTGLLNPIEEEQQQRVKDLTCPKCGLTYKKFIEIGKFGCGKCYETFNEDMKSLLKGIHGHTEHRGKVSKRFNDIILQKKEIESLRLELEECIDKENFERAALLRDEIKKIKGEIGKDEE